MHDTPTQSSDRLDQIIAEFLAAEESGAAPPPADVVAANPDVAEELRNFFANRQELAVALPDEPPRKRFVPPKVRYFGDYELIDEIARGGMGVVYRAKQTSLNRIVAIKMILAGHLARDEDVKRFRTEAEAAGRLKHPGIVPVHEVGVHEGHHYFSMDYIEGRSLAEIVRENPLPVRKAAENVRSIADAVQYAHQQGTLHRDLKPSNVLVDADDQVHVTDFGLAMRVDGDSELTRTGDILGTPAYMPPEQAQAKRGLIGPGSDVYSLGAILYELLTGRPPFRGESAVETLKLVIEAEPVSPRLLNPKVPRDLETICLKCLQKEPHKRYLTAEELSEELRRFLDGEPIVARPVGRIERAWRWCRRKPAAAGLIASVIVLVVGVFAGSLWYVNDRGERLAEAAVRQTQEQQRVLQLEQGIEDAMQTAELLREKSWTLTERNAEWEAMLASARAAHQHAQSLVDQRPEEIDSAMLRRVEELSRNLIKDEQDRQFAARHDEIFLELTAPGIGRTYGTEGLYPKLRDALLTVGLRVGETRVDVAVAEFQIRAEPVQKIWIAAFDACLLAHTRGSDSEQQWLGDLLLEVDSDPWRNDVRAALAVEPDPVVLRRLAENADVATQPTSLLLGLVQHMRIPETEEAGLSLLLKMQTVHPEDFWVNVYVGDVHLRFRREGFGAESDDRLWRPERAARYYSAALAVRPNYVVVLGQLGIALKYAGDLEGAETAYRRAIALKPDFAPPYFNLGILLDEQGKTDEVEAYFREALRIEPQSADFWRGFGGLLLERDDLDGAAAALQTAIELDSRNATTHRLLGEVLERSGDLEGAIAAYLRAVNLEYNHSETQLKVAILRSYTGDLDGHRRICEFMFNRHSGAHDVSQLVHLLGAHLISPELTRPELLEVAQRLVGFERRDDYWLLPLAHYRLAKDPETLPLLDPAAIENLPPESRILYDLVLALVRLSENRTEEARELIREARMIPESLDDGLSTWPWSPVARLWHEVAEAMDAAELQEPIPQLAPTYTEFLPALILTFRQAADAEPDSAPAHLNLGNALMLSDDVDGAIEEYRTAIDVDGQHARSYICLGNACLKRGGGGDAAQAVVVLQTDVNLEPWNASAHGSLVRAFRRTGDLHDAFRASQRAYELLPNVEIQGVEFVKSSLKVGQAETAVAVLRDTFARDASYRDRFLLTSLLHYMGDIDGYRAECERLWQDFSRSGGNLHDVLMSLLLFPGADVGEQVLATAESYAANRHPVRMRMLALAHYRRGEHQEAWEVLQSADSPRLVNSRITSLLCLAMIQLRLDKLSDARESIKSARTEYEASADEVETNWVNRSPWGVIPSLWREVQTLTEQKGLDEPLPDLPPTYTELTARADSRSQAEPNAEDD